MHAASRLILVGFVIACLAGCYTHHPAARDRGVPTPIPASVWNVAVDAELRELAAATPAVLYRYGVDESVPEDDRDPRVDELAASVDKRVTYTDIRAGGLLRLYEAPLLEDDDLFVEIEGFVPNGSFLTSRRLARERAEATLGEPTGAEIRFKFMRAMYRGLARADPTADELFLADQGFLVRTPPSSPDARGIVLHLPALLGNPFQERLLAHLEQHGWAIAHVETEAWIAGPNHMERKRALAARLERQRELAPPVLEDGASVMQDIDERLAAYKEIRRQVEAEIPIPDTGFEVREGGDADAVAGVIADAVDRHLIEHASAAAAMIGYIDENRPDVAGKPLVVLGFSAGALAAPTVAARLGDRVSAIVLVGGGASIYDVARWSEFTDGGLDVIPATGPAPPETLLDEVGERYRARSRVDPYHAASAVRGVPVLHVYGTDDTWVPTSAAETLRAQLGEPDRLVYDGGHRGLFYFLPGQRGFIARWMEDAVVREVTSTVPTPASAP